MHVWVLQKRQSTAAIYANVVNIMTQACWIKKLIPNANSSNEFKQLRTALDIDGGGFFLYWSKNTDVVELCWKATMYSTWDNKILERYTYGQDNTFWL